MKTIQKILIVSAAAASFTLVNRAGEVVMPPRSWDNQIQTVPDVKNDPDLLQYDANGNAKEVELMQSTATAPNDFSARDPDLLTYPSYYATMPPRTLQAWMEAGITPNYASHQDPDLLGPYYAETESESR